MPRPLAVRRHNEITRRIRAMGSVSVGELAESFGVSHETVRRDLKLLADQGVLDIVHGGAARRGTMEPALSQRSAENAEGKAAIARAAVAHVRDGATLLIDSGTTTAALAVELVARAGLTVCTNSLLVASTLCRVVGNRIFMFGGQVDGNDESTWGADTIEAIARFRVDIAFIGSGGFADDGSLTDYSLLAAEQRGHMILAGPAYVLADYTKFERRTPFVVPHFDKVAGVIVDRPPHDALAAAWQARGIRHAIAE